MSGPLPVASLSEGVTQKFECASARSIDLIAPRPPVPPSLEPASPSASWRWRAAAIPSIAVVALTRPAGRRWIGSTEHLAASKPKALSGSRSSHAAVGTPLGHYKLSHKSDGHPKVRASIASEPRSAPTPFDGAQGVVSAVEHAAARPSVKTRSCPINPTVTPGCERAQRASHAPGARRRSGARGGV